MLMAGWQQQFSRFSGGNQAGNFSRLPETDFSCEQQYQGLPPLGELVPLDTQLLSPSLARAFNVPTPVHLPASVAHFASPQGQAPPSWGLQANPANPCGRLPSLQQSSRLDPQFARSMQSAAGLNKAADPPQTVTYLPHTTEYPGSLGDFNRQQQIPQQVQQYQQLAGADLRSSLLESYEHANGDQERLQQLASQYAAAGYHPTAAAQPPGQPTATAFPPMNIQNAQQAAQAAMYGYQDAAQDAHAAALAQYAGAAGYPGMGNTSHAGANLGGSGHNHSIRGKPQTSQGVGDKRPAENSTQRPAQAGHSGLHSGNGSDDAAGLDEKGARALKRARLVWTPQLHQRFVDAVNQLGLKNAVPKTIMQLMSVEGLTRENVASHLQKYRLQLKRQPGDGSEDQTMPGGSLDGSADANARLAHPGPSSADEDAGHETKGHHPGPQETYGDPESIAAHHGSRILGALET